MKYFVKIGAENHQVTLTNPPNNDVKMDKYIVGGCFIGTPDLFVRLQKTGNKYKAFTLLRTAIEKSDDIEIGESLLLEPIAEEKPVEETKEVITEEKSEIVVEPEIATEAELEDLYLDIHQQEESIKSEAVKQEEQKHLYLYEKSQIIQILSDSIKSDEFTASFEEFTSTFEGSDIYTKDKKIWIILNGSEHLKIAFDMRCKCEKIYLIERIAKDFPGFYLKPCFGSNEIDSPDISTLRFLKDNAFTDEQKKTIKKYHCRICLAYDEDGTDENPYVVIKNFLCHCDIFIRIKDLVAIAYGDGRI